MNNERRKRLRTQIRALEELLTYWRVADIENCMSAIEVVKNHIMSICDDEEFSFNNMPENLQYSIRGETSEECIDMMTEAIDCLDEILTDVESLDIEEIEGKLEEARDLINDVIMA